MTPIMGRILRDKAFSFGTFLAYAVNVVETAAALLLITCLPFTAWNTMNTCAGSVEQRGGHADED